MSDIGGNLSDHRSPTYKGKKLVGKVVDNNDPEKLRRLRIRVADVWGSSIPDGDLPWCIQKPPNDSALGNTATCGSFGVPIVGSIMYVELQDGDSHFPMYSFGAVQLNTLKDLEATNYPHRYGFVDETGNWFYFDRQTGDWEFKHKSGYIFHINDVGALVITSPDPGTLTINCENVQVNGNVGISENLTIGNGASGTFTSSDGKVVTVQDGIITNID